jgi:hypothetical protein
MRNKGGQEILGMIMGENVHNDDVNVYWEMSTS